MPIDWNKIFKGLGGALSGWNTGGLGGAVGGALGLPPGTFPPIYGPGTGIGSGVPGAGGMPGSNPAARAAIEATLTAAGGQRLTGSSAGTVFRMPNGNCVVASMSGQIIPVICPPGTAPTDDIGPGGGGDFGGGGAGGDWGPPPPLPAPPGSTGGTCSPMPYGMGVSIVETPVYNTVAARKPGYVTVTLPFAVGGYQCGQKVHMLKEVAQKFGLYKPRRRPVLTYADLKCVRKAERVENKLKALTTRHTDYRVVKKK